jgi:ArsR family transcriptional regulator
MQLIAERLRLSQPTVSRHIELLKRAGFITVRRQQKWSYCSRNEDELAGYYGWLHDSLQIKERKTRRRG